MWLIRSIFWFEPGELGEITGKLRWRKFTYEASLEAEALFPMVIGLVAFSYYYSIWAALFYLWFCKFAIQALNKKKFFDPLP